MMLSNDLYSNDENYISQSDSDSSGLVFLLFAFWCYINLKTEMFFFFLVENLNRSKTELQNELDVDEEISHRKYEYNHLNEKIKQVCVKNF